jgi:hypothetical protein
VAQVFLAEHDEVVEVLLLRGLHPALGVGVEIWGNRSDLPSLHAFGCENGVSSSADHPTRESENPRESYPSNSMTPVLPCHPNCEAC